LGILLKKYLWVANLVAVAICSYFLAKIVSTFIADKLIVERNFALLPASGTELLSKNLPSFDQYKVILDRNIFDSKEVAAPLNTQEVVAETPNLEGPATKTVLPIKLLSTFSVGSGTDQRSTATIQTTTGSPEVYTLNDEKQFAPGVKITKILPSRIEFINGPRLEYAEIENFSGSGVTSVPLSKLDASSPKTAASGGVAKQGENKFVVDQAEIDNALANPDRLFTEVQAVPNFVGGKPAGIKLLAMTPTSVFAKLGLQRGDILDKINGTDLDIASGMNLFNQLKGQKRITIDLTRGGKKQTLDYEIR